MLISLLKHCYKTNMIRDSFFIEMRSCNGGCPKTYQAKPGEIKKSWYVVDADQAVVGRLASKIATILMGKHRPTYTPHVDTGDFVIVTNAEKVQFSGSKWDYKAYARYTGYPGQRVELAKNWQQRVPERILREAVRRMLPKNS